MTSPATPFRPEYGLIDGLVIQTAKFNFQVPAHKLTDLLRLLETYGDPAGRRPLEHFDYRIDPGEPHPIATISATGMRQVLEGFVENIVDCIYDDGI